LHEQYQLTPEISHGTSMDYTRKIEKFLDYFMMPKDTTVMANGRHTKL